MTYRYRELFIFLVVSKPVSEEIGTEKKSRNRCRKNLVPEKKSGNRYRQNLVPKKVPASVSKIFGTGKKVSVSVSFNILGTVTHWHSVEKPNKSSQVDTLRNIIGH